LPELHAAGSHTPNFFTDNIKTYKLDDKVLAICTDGDAKYKAAVRLRKL